MIGRKIWRHYFLFPDFSARPFWLILARRELLHWLESKLQKSFKMASFMDNEAIESEDEELSDDEERARAQVGSSPMILGPHA